MARGNRDVMEVVIATILNLLGQLGLPLLLLAVGWLAGRAAERAHFRSLERREKRFSHFVVADTREFQPGFDPSRGGALVTGGAVIASDYMKTFLASIRKILGGELRSYETLLERARREAVLRLMEDAHRRGYNAVCNIRLETADIGGMTGRRGAAMAEAFAFGTAYRIERGGEA